jgi:hypothetical protein
MPFEKIIKNLGTSINNVNTKINTVFNGKHTEKAANTKKSISKSISDIGIIGLLDLFASVDLCNILAYTSGQISSASGDAFDPTKNPKNDPNATALKIKKWNIQKAAYDIQKVIDKYHSVTGEVIDKTALDRLITDVQLKLINILAEDKGKNEASSYVLIGYSVISNYLVNVVDYLNSLPNMAALNNSDIQKVMSYVDKVREICIKIQSLGSPQSIATSFLSTALQSNLAKIQKVINPSKIIPAIQSIAKSAKAIRQTINTILSIVKTAQVIIKIAVVLIQVFKVILRFFKVLPAPTMYTTTGVIISAAAADRNITDKVNMLITDLKAISSLLDYIVRICTSLSINVSIVIDKLTLILANLESCNNAPIDLVNELKATRDDLIIAKANLDDFVNSSKNSKIENNSKIGEYTIIIKTEESSSNIRFLRRYGIAIGPNGLLAVESTPTFASDDNIIINEVKLLLISKGLIKQMPSNLSMEELTAIENALIYSQGGNYFEDTNYLDNVNIDPIDNEDETVGLGLNAFINGLKGGKKLKNRVKIAMNKQKTQLEYELKAQKDKKVNSTI